jgi:SP family facilitated glucose transporter-like MFS transporter 8
MYLLGGSEQARRPLLVADQEDPHYHHQRSNGGVDGNSSATGFLAFSTIVAATCSLTSGYRVRTLALRQSPLNF